MKRILYSRTSGRTISLLRYRLISHILVGIPLLLMMISSYVVREDILMCTMQIIMVLLIASVSFVATNQRFFGFDETALLIPNVMGYV